MKLQQYTTRREFLKDTVRAAFGLSLVPSLLTKRAGASQPSLAANDRITLGFIGTGGQGTHNMRAFLNNPEAQVVAVCDVDRSHRDRAKRIVDDHYGSDDCDSYNDFRELNARNDIDGVVVGTPDHWHTIPALDAARQGKDIYLEKPLTLTIDEGIKLREVIHRYERILQTGSQQRSDRDFRFACELVRNGYIGEVQKVEVVIPGNNRTTGPTWEPMPVPAGFDYDFWLGPAPWKPYTEQRCHYQFRFILDYSGGQVTNWGAHFLDIAQWGLGMDDSGPVEVFGDGEFPETGLFTTATQVDFTCIYENGVEMTCKTGGTGTKFIGTEGSVFVSRSRLETEPASLLETRIKPDELHLYESNDHHQNFLDSMRSRRNPIADVEIGHRSATICHLGNIAMLTKRRHRWDPAAEKFIGDDAANRMTGRPSRGSWRID